jgi:hypothetical protein
MSERETEVEIPFAADCCPCGKKLRTVSETVRYSLVLTLHQRVRTCSAGGVAGMERMRPANSCMCAGSLKSSTDARTCCVISAAWAAHVSVTYTGGKQPWLKRRGWGEQGGCEAVVLPVLTGTGGAQRHGSRRILVD